MYPCPCEWGPSEFCSWPRSLGSFFGNRSYFSLRLSIKKSRFDRASKAKKYGLTHKCASGLNLSGTTSAELFPSHTIPGKLVDDNGIKF